MHSNAMPAGDAGNEASHHPIDKWLPWMIVAVFIVLFIVLGAFVRVAFSSFNGVVTDRPYERGLAYNDEIASRQAQVQSGYVPHVTVTPLGGQRVKVLVAVTNKDGERLLPHSAKVLFIRPTQAGMDLQFVLRPSDSAFAAEIVVPVRGLWDIVAQTETNGVRLQTSTRIVL